jgi:hypothetical protein
MEYEFEGFFVKEYGVLTPYPALRTNALCSESCCFDS